MKYMVDIPMCVYNHEKYIAKAIEGVVLQKANFKFRLLIGEDASPDNSKGIIQEYVKKYPNIVFPTFHENNIGVSENTKILLSKCTSKYIALCDGDDYWSDPYKLQKQVDFLESHPNVTICGHEIAILNSNGKIEYPTKKTDKFITFNDELQRTNFSTLSLVFRNNILPLSEWFYKLPQGDWGLKLIQLNKGKGYFLKDCMAVYRQHEGGIWSNQKPKELDKKVLKAYRIFLEAFPMRKKDIQFAIIKYKLKHKLFFKELNRYSLADFLLLIKFGFLKIIK